jgi:AAA+ superfamily predicted ATPase
MNADCKGALMQINKSYKCFVHKGKTMSKAEVKAVLKYAIEKGYEHTGMLSNEEVENVLKKINRKEVSNG